MISVISSSRLGGATELVLRNLDSCMPSYGLGMVGYCGCCPPLSGDSICSVETPPRPLECGAKTKGGTINFTTFLSILLREQG